MAVSIWTKFPERFFVAEPFLLSSPAMLTATLLLSLFITLALGFYVFVAAPHHTVNRAFTLFNGLMIGWIVKDLAFWGFHEANTGGHEWAIISFLLGIALQFALLIFVDVFPDNAPVRWHRIAWLALPLLVFIPLLFAGALWHRVGFINNEFAIHLKPTAFAYGAYNTFLLCLAFAALWRKFRQANTQLSRQQIGSVLLAKSATSLLAGVGANILPLFGYYQLLPLISVFILIGSLIYAFAISNFRLFSLQSALDQMRLFPLAYKVTLAVSVIGLLGFYLIQLPIAWWIFDAQSSGWRPFIIFSTISGLVPTLILILVITKILSRPLRSLTETALDVARGNYGAQSPFTSNDELGVLADSFNAMSRKMADDIAQLKAINQAMIRTEKLATAGALATGVAHEVNNPLAAISSLVQSLLGKAKDDKERETLRLILTQITRISGVLRDLMDFARPKAPELKPTDLNQVILKSLELACFDKGFKRLAVTTALAGDLPPLQLDADRMQQVFLNLLLNARDAIGEQAGEIALRTARRNGDVCAEISDNGCGIDAAHLESVFDPFFTTKQKGQGTGLGLSVSHSIVTAHGGRIAAQAAERGATFVISFPLPHGGTPNESER
jgi:signal transduction histidine kinase